ncbi:MAG: twin-arginine translocase TatA/TatE family subunit [Rubripirellula sp.]|jgi:sec-independent protein translocase protein TatA|nr:twin-arginine translocase TatA/TatE family subunit [Rubripirellula sp.]
MILSNCLNLGPIGLLGFISPGPLELAIIAGIVLLLFGGSKLPSLMRNLGRSTNEFKRGMSESLDEDEPNPKNDENN